MNGSYPPCILNPSALPILILVTFLQYLNTSIVIHLASDRQ